MNGKRLLLTLTVVLCALALAFAPCEAQKAKKKKGNKKGGGAKAGAAQVNTLSEQEKAAGWQLLFDGTTFANWRGLNKKEGEIPKNFEITDGLIHKKPGKPAGDLATSKGYNNFELSFEWKLTEGGNNGIKYNVSETLSKGGSALGYEYQVLDDQKASDRLDAKHQAASLYELFPPDNSKKQLKPVGEWNSSKIVYNGNKIEHWLNGQKVVEAEAGSPAMTEALAKSKWKKIAAEFGKRLTDGRIVITDHESECWYRNIKIHELQ